ncbi:MAG: NAD(P)H-dependent oxidoreductase [Pseudomonadota bacterium]
MSDKTLLRVDSSARIAGSQTRKMTDALVREIAPETIIPRDLACPIPHIDAAWVDANFTAPAERSAAQQATLKLSDRLVDELMEADTVVIGAPIYNFGVPASLKAWIDQIARTNRTFRYTANGPVGLLDGKSATIAVSSGGTAVGSSLDYATDYLRHVLGFIGIEDVTVIDARSPEGQALLGVDNADLEKVA